MVTLKKVKQDVLGGKIKNWTKSIMVQPHNINLLNTFVSITQL